MHLWNADVSRGQTPGDLKPQPLGFRPAEDFNRHPARAACPLRSGFFMRTPVSKRAIGALSQSPECFGYADCWQSQNRPVAKFYQEQFLDADWLPTLTRWMPQMSRLLTRIVVHELTGFRFNPRNFNPSCFHRFLTCARQSPDIGGGDKNKHCHRGKHTHTFGAAGSNTPHIW